MGNWNLQPVATLEFEHPTNDWAMRATLYRSGALEVVAEEGHVSMLAHGNEDDACYDEAVAWAGKLARASMTQDQATALLEDEGVEVLQYGGWRSV